MSFQFAPTDVRYPLSEWVLYIIWGETGCHSYLDTIDGRLEKYFKENPM